MSEQIKLDAARLSDIAVQIKQVSSRLEDVENKISQALTALDWEVRSKEDIEGNINDIKNNLVRQRENLNAMTGVIERASDKTNEINADLTRVALSIVTAVLASVSVFNPIGKIGVISYLTGVKDWLTNVTGGGENDSNNTENAEGNGISGGVGNSGNETDSYSVSDEEYFKIMRQRYDNTLSSTNRKSFKGNCGAFTFQQLKAQGIVNEERPDSGLGKDYYAYWSNKSSTSTGYQVEAIGSGNALNELISRHPDELIENVVVSFDYDGKNYKSQAGHVLLISKISKGYVYYMESQSGKFWNLKERYDGKDFQSFSEGEPLKLTLDEFQRQYPNMNGAVHFYK